MKKILLSISMIALVAVVVMGATGAFFSDTETSTGNTFTAGAIDLKIDSTQHYNNAVCTNGVWVVANPTIPQYPVAGTACGGSWALKDLIPTSDQFFNFTDIKPGDSGENTISLHVSNNDAWMCANVSNLTSNDNGLTEPESAVDSTDGVGNGELASAIEWEVWKDDGEGGGTACDNIQNGAEPTLTSGNPTNGSMALYDSTTGDGPLAAGSDTCLGVSWSLPLSSGNETQTDSLTGDISFNVEQSRGNEGFVCGGSTPTEPQVTTTTGQGWSPEASGVLNQNRWLAKSRYGGINTYELEVGFGPGLRDEDNHNTWADNVGETFTLNYNNSTKIATLVVGSDVSTYTVAGAGTPTSIGITAKGSASSGITKFTGVTLNGNAIPNTVATTTHAYTSISGPAVAGNFVLTGTVTLDWVTPVNEGPTLQIDVKY